MNFMKFITKTRGDLISRIHRDFYCVLLIRAIIILILNYFIQKRKINK